MDEESLGIIDDNTSLSGFSDYLNKTAAAKEDTNNDEELNQDDLDPPESRVSIDIKIAIRNGTAMKDHIDPNEEEDELPEFIPSAAGLRGRTTTTPMSNVTDLVEVKSLKERSTADLTSGPRDVVFQRAMTLMSERCTSIASIRELRSKTPLVAVKTLPFGVHVPKYFYVNQTKPAPMPPLKAWRGYNGNVYFEPIRVQSSSGIKPENEEEELSRKMSISQRLHNNSNLPLRNSFSLTSKPGISSQAQRFAKHRKFDIPRKNDNRSNFEKKGPRQMVLLDKQAVFTKSNNYIHEDVGWIIGQESTGSLKVIEEPKAFSRGALLSREKIHRGSVAHKVYASKEKTFPFLTVSGGKVAPKVAFHSKKQNQHGRKTLNSPDFTSYENLPPLEQLKAKQNQLNSPNAKLSRVQVPPQTKVHAQTT